LAALRIGTPGLMQSLIFWILWRKVWEGTATMIKSAEGTTWATESLMVRESGKDAFGRNRTFRRSDWSCSASAAVRASILTGIFFLARMIPSAVPQVVVPITATVASKTGLLLGICC
jgi:hypothetical protein